LRAAPAKARLWTSSQQASAAVSPAAADHGDVAKAQAAAPRLAAWIRPSGSGMARTSRWSASDLGETTACTPLGGRPRVHDDGTGGRRDLVSCVRLFYNHLSN